MTADATDIGPRPDRLVSLDRRALLAFYDEKPADSQGHATAVNAVAGEELGLGLLAHYLRNALGADAAVLDERATPGALKGSRLDGWVRARWPDRAVVLYQVEVKNWSAHSYGGKTVPVDAPEAVLAAYRRREWNERIWEADAGRFRLGVPALAKVLQPMRPPPGYDRAETVACLWAPMHPEGSADPWFEVTLAEGGHFARLHVFSMSSYLRGLEDDHITLEMPSTLRRMRWLRDLFGEAV